MRITVCPWNDFTEHIAHRQETLAALGEGARFPVHFDRGIQKSAKGLSQTAQGTAAGYGSGAAATKAALEPGIERDANSPTGLTPEQRSNYIVSGAEAVGGANSALSGEAKLGAMRTRNASGFAPALAEAARAKTRQLATNVQDVNKLDTQVALEKQKQARDLLAGLYGTDVGAQLRGMGISDEALNTALEAGKSGWQQNAMGWINTLKPKYQIGGGSVGG